MKLFCFFVLSHQSLTQQCSRRKVTRLALAQDGDRHNLMLKAMIQVSVMADLFLSFVVVRAKGEISLLFP